MPQGRVTTVGQTRTAIRNAVASGAGLMLWLLVWALNGWFTVVWLQAAGALAQQAQPGLYTPALNTVSQVFSSIIFCWLIHLAASLVEGNWQREMRKAGALTFLVVIGWDTYTTVAGIGQIALSYDFVITGWYQLAAWALALALALLPEHMIVRHLKDMGALGKRKHDANG